MLRVKEIVNCVFTSKTYILYQDDGESAWLVDIGDIGPVVSFCEERGLKVKGVFLTHAHFDHIYGLKSLIEHYPGCYVFTNEYGKKMLVSDKINLSKYHDNPFSYEGDNVVVLHEGDTIHFFDEAPAMSIYETPGHNPSCITMALGGFLFTGDSYIPGMGVNTHLPHSEKHLAEKSLERIMSMAVGKIVCAGHVEINASKR